LTAAKKPTESPIQRGVTETNVWKQVESCILGAVDIKGSLATMTLKIPMCQDIGCIFLSDINGELIVKLW
jgi:hypothetical protein